MSASNSTESILNLGICSAIIGLVIFFAVLHIACVKKKQKISEQMHKKWRCYKKRGGNQKVKERANKICGSMTVELT